METQNILKSKQSKFLLGLAIVFVILLIAKAGYDFGQWLQHVLN